MVSAFGVDAVFDVAHTVGCRYPLFLGECFSDYVDIKNNDRFLNAKDKRPQNVISLNEVQAPLRPSYYVLHDFLTKKLTKQSSQTRGIQHLSYPIEHQKPSCIP